MMRLNHEDALAQLANYDETEQQYYRDLRSWLNLTPRQALRFLLQERAHDALKYERDGIEEDSID